VGDKGVKLPSWAKLFLIGGLLVVVLPCTLTFGLFRAWEQEGPSMAPSLPDGTGFFASRFGTPEPGDVVVSAHACGALTERVLEAAMAAGAPVAVLPCCHDLERCDTGGLSGWIDGALAVDDPQAVAEAGGAATRRIWEMLAAEDWFTETPR